MISVTRKTHIPISGGILLLFGVIELMRHHRVCIRH